MENKNNEIILTVGEAYTPDVGRDFVRVSKDSLRMLGINAGDNIELSGQTTVIVRVDAAPHDDFGLGIIRLDTYLRKKVAVEIGGKITVRKCALIVPKPKNKK